MRPQRTEFEPIALGDRETTLLMKSILIPRPIAWVGTTDDAGVANLAPHSFFTMVSETPPVVMFSSTGRKDTLANAEATGEFTVSLVSRPQFEEANQTSAGYAPEVSEFEAAAVAQEPSAVVAPPRVGHRPQPSWSAPSNASSRWATASWCWGRVVHVAVDTRTLSTDARGRTLPLAQDLDPLARLGSQSSGAPWATSYRHRGRTAAATRSEQRS